MNKYIGFGCLGIVILGLIFAIGVACWGVGTLNQEAILKNTVLAKVKANEAEHDKMTKIIQQGAQITQAEAEAVSNIILGYAQARGKSSGSLATMVKEAIPTIDANTLSFKNLMNSVTIQRESFNRVQGELININLTHDNLFDTIPSGPLMSMFGRQKLDISKWVVTSSTTQEAFKTGQDNNTDLGLSPKKVEK